MSLLLRASAPLRECLLNRRSLRFSLRELLLFMLACAAFFGWAHVTHRKSQPFRATRIAECIADGLGNEISDIAADLDEKGKTLLFGSRDGMDGKDQIRLRWDADLQMPLKKAYRLRRELIRRAIGRIKEARLDDPIGCVENWQELRLRSGDSDSPPQTDSRYLDRDQTGVLGFWEDEIHYRCGEVYGQLRFSILAIDTKPIRLMARLHEWRPQ